MSKNERKLIIFMAFVIILSISIIIFYNINLNRLDNKNEIIKNEIIDKNKELKKLEIKEKNIKDNHDLYKNQKESISDVIKGLEEKINEE